MSLEFRIARALNELEEIYKLRYQIYLQVGYIKKEDYLNNQEKDEFDQYSKHFYAYSTEEKKVVGAIRLVLDSKIGFPVEELYDISFLRKQNKKIVEVSRRITLPNRAKANLGLLGIISKYSIKNRIDCFVCSVNPDTIDFYKKLGMKKFGSVKYYSKVHMPAIGMYIGGCFSEPYLKQMLKMVESSDIEDHLS